MKERVYGVTQEYNRRNYEKGIESRIKKEVVDEYFKGEKTKYNRNGRLMHRSVKAAQRKYKGRGSRNAIEADHIDPIAAIHRRNKHKKFINDQDIREVARQRRNFQHLSKSANASKKDLSGLEAIKNKKVAESLSSSQKVEFVAQSVVQPIITDIQLDARNIDGGIHYYSDKAINITKSSVSNMHTKFGQSANIGLEAALMTLTVSSISNLSLVAAGEKSLESAMNDVAQNTGSSFVGAAGLDLAQRTIADIANNFKNTGATRFLGKGLPITEISTAIMVGNSVIKYINEDISAEECVSEIMMNGAGIIAYQLGLSIGGPAGAIVASVVCSQVCKIVTDYKNIQKLSEERLSRINSMASQALIEMENQRNILKELIDDKYNGWDKCIDNGFALIYESATENNSKGISEGLNKILEIIDKKVTFSSREEFNSFFDDENAILKF